MSGLRKRWGWALIALIAGLTGLLLVGAAYAGFSVHQLLQALQAGDQLQAVAPKENERVNVLVLGADRAKRGEASRSDVIMVASIDPVLDEAAVLSIPRDTRVTIPGRAQPEKIGHALAHGGPGLARETVEQLLDITIHNTVVIDFDAFIGIVDALGGVEVEVRQHLQYGDDAQNLQIDIPAGVHHMDGEMALDYVRYRSDSDIHRINRQQRFVAALARQALRLDTLFRLEELRDQLIAHVVTDLDGVRLLRLARMAISLPPEALTLATLPGEAVMLPEDGQYISYWLIDPEASERAVDRLIRGIDHERNAGIRVQVVDGSGTGALGEDAVARLQSWGYEAVASADADSEPSERSVVIIHGTDMGHRDLLIRTLGRMLPDSNLLLRQETAGSTADVTLILGRDALDLQVAR